MSFWYMPKKSDIEIDGEDINILLGSDESGNIWAEVKLKDILDLIDKNK